MEHKFIRVLAWLQFLSVFSLVVNHMFRCLHWYPLLVLFLPSIAMIICVEKECE